MPEPFLSPQFPDYELIDSGDGLKYERFGEWKLIRPETSALWLPSTSHSDWRKNCEAEFLFNEKGRGNWKVRNENVNSWTVQFPLKGHSIAMEMRLTKFKHIGLFPEQSSNWQAIYDACLKSDKVLNLFAYTGAASLAARAAGATVTHVDSIKQVVSWAKSNMELSRLNDIRWIVEDAQRFIQREARRGNTYDIVIMDPPSWGQGNKGEKWRLEDRLNNLLKDVQAISHARTKWFISTYSGLSPLVLENIIKCHTRANVDSRELAIAGRGGHLLPQGTTARVGF